MADALPLGFLSRKVTPVEMNYSVSEQAWLALIYGITPATFIT